MTRPIYELRLVVKLPTENISRNCCYSLTSSDGDKEINSTWRYYSNDWHRVDSADNDAYLLKGTHLEISELKQDSLLIEGQKYEITDFATKHRILDGNTVTTDFNTGAIEPLILTATSTNTFDKQAYSTLYPQDIIYYDITGGDIRDIAFFDEGVAITGLKGVIYYRKDTLQNVECWYDFRNVKYRRWLVNATPWVAEGTYVAKNVYEYDNILYKCLVDHTGVVTNPDLDTINWIKRLDKTQNWSWTSDKTQFNVGDIVTDNLIMSNPIDVYTFGDYYNRVNDVHIGRIYLDYMIDIGYSSRLNNIVFNTIDDIYVCYSNTFGENCYNNTIGNSFSINTIGNGFYYNTIGNDFISNTIGNSFYFNTIGNSFYFNTIGNGFYYNTIGNDFNSNTIGNSFRINTIGDDFRINTIGNDFRINTIGDDFYYNTIGNDFRINTIGDGFYYNTIGNYFISNTIGNSFYFNTIGNGFNYNTIGNDFISNTIGNSFYFNTIGNSFNSNIIGNDFRHNDFKYCPSLANFTTATHVYADYNCEIFKNSAGVLRLKYVDRSDANVIVDITA